jgi:predicted metal-dependent HD superfamily phosphohydrolase
MPNFSGLVKETEAHVISLFRQHYQPKFVYHNLDHTQTVVARVEEITPHYNLSEKEKAELLVAAWFHDTGYLLADAAKHEEKSAELMTSFLQSNFKDDEFINKATSLILVTRFPPTPQTLQEMIICDADTYHFGLKDEFRETNKAIKQEYILSNMASRVQNWEKNTLKLLLNHQFYTSYCKEVLQKGKDKNIKFFRKKIEKSLQEGSPDYILAQTTDGDEKSLKQKTALNTKGIQTMLRLTSENHLELSNMADGKASILISVNAIIISVILSLLIRRIQVDTYLTIPTIIFLISSVATIILAILATRPKVSEGNFSREDILNKKTNLLFFGNFYKSSLEEYKWAMNTMMRDTDYLYESVIQDIYFLGVVLARKYKLIRMAYTVFMIGILVSVLAFVIAMLVHEPSQTIVNESSVSPFR